MKIGFVVNHPTQFEVPFYQFVAKAYPEHSFEVFYLKEQENQHFDRELGQQIKWGFNLFEGYPHHFLPKDNAINTFEKLLANELYDLIIVNGYKNQYSGFAAVCKKAKVRVALRLDTVLFNQTWWQIMLRKLVLKSVYAEFDRFLVTGNVSKDYILKMGIGADKVNIFSYCVDRDFFDLSGKGDSEYYQNICQKYKANQEKVILSVAKFVERESPWDILKAFIQLSNPNLSLVLVGDGSEKEALKNLAKQHPHLKIHFPGYIPYPHLPEFYKLSEVFIHAAQDEPWGVSVQEAMAGNCFVICSDKVGASFDLLVSGKNGFTYTYGQTDELANYIHQALNIKEEVYIKTNQQILDRWNYDFMFQEVLKAAE